MDKQKQWIQESIFTEKSGFVDIEQKENCLDSEHSPPTHLYIPYGKKYIHVCPKCGNRIELHSSQFMF